MQLFHGSIHVFMHPMLGLFMAPSCSLLRPRQKSLAQAALFVLVGIEEVLKGLSEIESITSQNLSQPLSNPLRERTNRTRPEDATNNNNIKTQPTAMTSRCKHKFYDRSSLCSSAHPILCNTPRNLDINDNRKKF